MRYFLLCGNLCFQIFDRWLCKKRLNDTWNKLFDTFIYINNQKKEAKKEENKNELKNEIKEEEDEDKKKIDNQDRCFII